MPEFNDLTNLLNDWPLAVDPHLICDPSSEESLSWRATSILEIVVGEPLQGKKFLDYGCGDGNVANIASETAKFSIGYDIDLKINVKQQKCKLTNDFAEVQANAPYGAILLYDVIDHSQDPMKVLGEIKSVLSPGGKVYMRTHPWTSRHASHLYRTFNKAFAHLVFTEEELANLGYSQMHTIKLTHPIINYKSWLQSSGLSIARHNIIKDGVEPFFHSNPLLAQRIKANWKNSHNLELAEGRVFPAFQMEQQFHDFVLTH